MPKPLLDLPPPLIYAVENSGGLGYNLVGPGATQPVMVIIGPWDKFITGDEARIHWGGPDGPVLASRPMTEADNYQAIGVPVPAESINALGPGIFDVIHENASVLGNPVSSPPYPVEVKLTLPGGFDPQPDTETINENLQTATVRPWPLADDLSNVRVVLKRYDNIAESDRITVSWHGYQYTIEVGATDLSRAEFEIPIPEADIRQAGGGTVKVSYRIIDRVGNSSKWAPYADIDVPIDDPGSLPRPRVVQVEADGITLDLALLGTSDVVVQPVNNGGLAGATIVVTWNGIAADGTMQPPYYPPSKALAYDYEVPDFVVPNAQAVALAGGRANVSYTRTNPGDVMVDSLRRPLRVVGAPGARLPPPTLTEQVNDTIPADLALAHLVIPPQTRGTAIEVDVAAPVSFHAMQDMHDPSHPPTFVLPGPSFIAPNAGQLAQATYTVTGAGYRATSQVYAFSVLAAAPPLSAPTLLEAQGSQLDPVAASQGITVLIPADASIGPTDGVEVTVTGSGGAVTTSPSPGSPSGMRVSVGPAVVASNLGNTIAVGYTVTPQSGTPRVSANSSFQVLDLADNDPRVTPPSLSEANAARTLDLNTFTGPATVNVRRWPLMAAGQRFWLTAESGTSSQPVAVNEAVTPGNLQRSLLRGWLDTLADGALLAVHLDITFDGSTQQGKARRFTSPFYTLKAKNAPPTFSAPEIPEATQGKLDGARTAATLRVPGAGLLVGDSVTAAFGAHPLGTKVVTTAGNDLTFSITRAMIVAAQGHNIVSAYTVTRSGTSTNSAPLSVFVTVPASPWDATFDFDNEATRSESSTSGRQLRFEGVFHVMFDRNHLPTKEQFIGVKPLQGAPVDDYYKNQVLWIGHPSDDTLIEKRVLCELYETWSRVRFAISVMDDPVTVTFQDEQRRVIGAVQTLTPPASKYVSVEGNAVDERRIKWIEIRCPDTIHLDFFKFKR